MDGQLDPVKQDIRNIQERIVRYEQKLAVAEQAGNKEEEKSLINLLSSLQEKENILLRSQAPSQQQELVSFWAKPYRQQLQALPAPSKFGTVWSAFQTPQGNLADEVEFERHGPLLNIYRPQSAKKRDGEFTTAACQTVLRLITILSDSYIDTRNKSVLGQLQATFGPQFVGESPGREKSMLSLVCEELLYFFQQVMTPDVCFMTLEPSLTSGGSKIHVFIVEGKEDWGYGGGSNPVMQLAAYYAKVLEDNWDTSFVTDTLLPAVGVEVFGHGLRVHALFHTNKICCEPLTEWLHFADLRDGQPDYMVYLVRTIQALGVLVNSVCMELAAAHQPLQLRAARNKQLTDGIPHMLRNNSHDIKQLAKRKHVYHVIPESGKSWVAKVVATPYPWQLHEELSALGLAPKLVTPVEGHPGRVQVIKMEYLDPADGWVRLERFTGDWDALHEVAMEALKSLQSCLDGKAVHGDLNPSSLLVRERKPDCEVRPSERPQVMFLDLAWGGQQGQVTYPPFVNGKAVRTVKKPDGQLISRKHDTLQLKETLGRCRRQQYRQPDTNLQHCASVHACKQYVRSIVFSGKPALFTRIT
ncbi:hypothetical protein ABBQ32_010444 [Trebouxia sp. C0010 RCD-2024]